MIKALSRYSCLIFLLFYCSKLIANTNDELTPNKAITELPQNTEESDLNTPKQPSTSISKKEASDLLYQWLAVSLFTIFFIVCIMILLRKRNL